MCGIAGLVGKMAPPAQQTMDRMLECIRHRGPDGDGQWADGRLRLGHRRLAILDLTAHGDQPMLYGRRYVLVFNGEIYNYRELRRELEEKGYSFRTRTDSEVIPAAYDCWGPACQQKMNGMWAFALYDLREQVLFCSRDRFGIKPFYYTQTPELFAFGSEIKQLLTLSHEKPRANRTVLEVFLAVGYRDYSEQTMFQDIFQLRGGHCLTCQVNTGQIRVERWFDMLSAPEKPMETEEAAHRFAGLFEKAVDRHLRADVEVGSCLSGGLDSSAIVCEVNRQLREKGGPVRQRTISSCFDDPRYDEQEYIDAVVGCCDDIKVDKVFPRMDQLLPALERMVWHMDEPFGSTSIFAQWSVYRRAKELGLKVMLDGQGADEQLAGYTDFYKMLFAWLFRRGRWCALAREMGAYFHLRSQTERRSQLHFLAVALVEALMPLWAQERLFRAYHTRKGDQDWLRISEKSWSELGALKRRYAKRDPREYSCAYMEIGMSELLHYEDRNSMAFSVEARVPFLDADLAAALMETPFSYKIRQGKTKWIMRKALEGILPEKIVNRYDKMGFVTPEYSWFAEHHEELEPFMMQAAQALAPVVDPEAFMEWYHSPAARRCGDLKGWRVLCAGQWARTFQVQI